MNKTKMQITQVIILSDFLVKKVLSSFGSLLTERSGAALKFGHLWSIISSAA
jgi:hypothetical protein